MDSLSNWSGDDDSSVDTSVGESLALSRDNLYNGFISPGSFSAHKGGTPLGDQAGERPASRLRRWDANQWRIAGYSDGTLSSDESSVDDSMLPRRKPPGPPPAYRRSTPSPPPRKSADRALMALAAAAAAFNSPKQPPTDRKRVSDAKPKALNPQKPASDAVKESAETASKTASDAVHASASLESSSTAMTTVVPTPSFTESGPGPLGKQLLSTASASEGGYPVSDDVLRAVSEGGSDAAELLCGQVLELASRAQKMEKENRLLHGMLERLRQATNRRLAEARETSERAEAERESAIEDLAHMRRRLGRVEEEVRVARMEAYRAHSSAVAAVESAREAGLELEAPPLPSFQLPATDNESQSTGLERDLDDFELHLHSSSEDPLGDDVLREDPRPPLVHSEEEEEEVESFHVAETKRDAAVRKPLRSQLRASMVKNMASPGRRTFSPRPVRSGSAPKPPAVREASPISSPENMPSVDMDLVRRAKRSIKVSVASTPKGRRAARTPKQQASLGTKGWSRARDKVKRKPLPDSPQQDLMMGLPPPPSLARFQT
jgi:hypothetical protein